MVKLTQCERVIRHLNDFGTITSREAMMEYGIFRLASRISDLNKQGYKFDVTFKSEKNRYGEPTSFAVYRIKEQPNNGGLV